MAHSGRMYQSHIRGRLEGSGAFETFETAKARMFALEAIHSGVIFLMESIIDDMIESPRDYIYTFENSKVGVRIASLLEKGVIKKNYPHRTKILAMMEKYQRAAMSIQQSREDFLIGKERHIQYV